MKIKRTFVGTKVGHSEGKARLSLIKMITIWSNLTFSKVCFAAFFFLIFSTFKRLYWPISCSFTFEFWRDLDEVFFHYLFHNYYKIRVRYF